jgi:hypothetical protein
MRCDGFLLSYQEVISDPKFSGCVSHAECIQWEDRVDKEDMRVDKEDMRVESNPHTEDILVPEKNSTSVENNTAHEKGNTVYAECHTSNTHLDMKLDITNDVNFNNRMKS